MILLAFEFSSDLRTVAVLRDLEVLAETEHARSRHTPVFDLVNRALVAAGIDRAEVDALAVGLGPGSYTGVRIAISAVQGWSLGRPVRVAGISSFDALARQLTGPDPLWIAADAQREEYAVAPAAGGRCTGPVRLVSREELKSWAAAGQRVVGPDLRPRLEVAEERFPRAADVGRLAVEFGNWVLPEMLAPAYLREAAFVKAPPQREIPDLPAA